MTPNKFSLDLITKLKQELEQQPLYEPTHCSKQQAISELAPEIVSLRSKGYTWNAIAKLVSDKGVPVSAAVLRTYLRRFQQAHERRAPRQRRRRTTRPPRA